VCTWLELDRRDAAIQIAEQAPERVGQLDPSAPEPWRAHVIAIEEFMAAVRGLPPGGNLSGLPERAHPSLANAVRFCLALAGGVRAWDAGRPQEAAVLAQGALPLVGGDLGTAVRPLMLKWLALADLPALQWQRYAEESAQLRAEARRTTVRAARNHVAAERVLLDHERLSLRAYVDELTGLANRHAYARHLAQLRAAPVKPELAAVLVDVDHFKTVNDTFGHVIGDDVLRVMGTVLVVGTRETDLAVRLGGDEFLLLLSGPSAAEVSRRSQELSQRVRDYPWDNLALGLKVTVSVGAATGSIARIEELLALADDQLYLAKTRGRDQVAIR
jgi:diguanylate cyclase (GGDEF)-like protein